MDVTNVRVDATLVADNAGKLVRLVGKCELFDLLLLLGVVSANGKVQVAGSEGMEKTLQAGKFYEIMGKVTGDGQAINIYTVVELGDNTDVDTASKLARLSQKVPEIFHG